MDKSFSKQINGFVFIFYPKVWTVPNMSIRHVHGGHIRNTYALDADGRCTYDEYLPEMDTTKPKGKRGIIHINTRRCQAVVTEELKRRAIHEMLGIGDDGHVPSYFTETVTFKTANVLTKLSPEWYVRRYKNQYTKNETRWVFYHDCLKKVGMVSGDTIYKGAFDFLMPLLDIPWACQVCGTKVPSGLQLVSKLTKANIRM